MKFDIFFSICQTEVDGYIPSERTLFANFMDQVKLADRLGYGTAWVAETHLSCQVQKEHAQPVIPHFKGEIGLNTDIFQLAHKVFSWTKRIHVGSAISNLLCNGGPIAHAEALKTFLTLQGLDTQAQRILEFGFAAGRFPFSTQPYGIVPRSEVEVAAWPALKGKIFAQASEIFLRLLKNEHISSQDVTSILLTRDSFRHDADWHQVQTAYQQTTSEPEPVTEIRIPPFWCFEKIGVIPYEAPMHLVKLMIGSHDPQTQKMVNTILPCGVFNLSITPTAVIDATHRRMEQDFNPRGGKWKRAYLPRTTFIFINGDEGLTEREQNKQAQVAAESALSNYWRAMEGTLDTQKVTEAVGNALVGNPQAIVQKIKAKYHPEDRLMLWFDFNNHNNDAIKESMQRFMHQVVPLLAQPWPYSS